METKTAEIQLKCHLITQNVVNFFLLLSYNLYKKMK